MMKNHIWRESILAELKEAASAGTPVMGTCAGLVLLVKADDEEVVKIKQPLLGFMDVKVKRNAFGRQRESFFGMRITTTSSWVGQVTMS